METSTLIHTLIARGDYDQLRGAHQTLRQAASAIQDEDRYLLSVTLDYAERYLRYPSYQELEAYLTNSPHMDGRLPVDVMALRCKELAGTAEAHQGSMAQVLDDYTYAGRCAHYVHGFQKAAAIVTMGTEGDPRRKQRDLKGPDDAMEFIREHASGDFTVPSSAPEGAWRANADLGAEALIDGLNDTIKARCYTGFKHIDDAVAIGPKHSIKYIGILGFTNHGKSMLLRSMIYNMAKAGKRVLFVAREDTALNTWTQLSFLHSYERRDLHIPPVNVWRNQPQKVTKQEQDNLVLLVDDLQHGSSVPGEIVVKTLAKWPDIVQELEVGLNGKPYDVLALDYLAHLDTGLTGPKMHDEYKRLFKQAQKIAIDYKSGRGLVVITPLQANKAGMKAADDAEDEDWGIYPDLGSVEQYTDSVRDMDLVISLWHKGELKDRNMMKLACLKSRENFFEPHFVRIDRRTRMVMDLPGHPKSNVQMISTYHAEAEEAALTPEELNAY